MAEEKGAQDQASIEPREFFVRLTNPVTMRRNILESSKSLLGILKEMYVQQEIRDKKKLLLSSLKKEMDEIKMLLQKLEDRMPQYSKSDIKKYFPTLDLEKKGIPIKNEVRPDQVVDKAVKEADSEMEMLAKALANVEQRMASLPQEKSSPNYSSPFTQDPMMHEKPKQDKVDDLGKALSDLKKKLSSF